MCFRSQSWMHPRSKSWLQGIAITRSLIGSRQMEQLADSELLLSGLVPLVPLKGGLRGGPEPGGPPAVAVAIKADAGSRSRCKSVLRSVCGCVKQLFHSRPLLVCRRLPPSARACLVHASRYRPLACSSSARAHLLILPAWFRRQLTLALYLYSSRSGAAVPGYVQPVSRSAGQPVSAGREQQT